MRRRCGQPLPVPGPRCRQALAWCAAALVLHPVALAAGLAPWVGVPGAAERVPAAPWFYAGLPQQKPPATRFTLEDLDGQPALRVQAQGSYGNLVHRLADTPAGQLSWRWRVDRPLQAADLRSRAGDDTALKVCALFDMPRDRVPFFERQLLRLAEARSGTALPNATVCYVWDPAWPPGSVVPNAYTRRVRYLTLGSAGPGWQAVRRNLAADFLLAFGDEAQTVPTLQAVAIGADADNTGGSSLGWVTGLELRPEPGP